MWLTCVYQVRKGHVKCAQKLSLNKQATKNTQQQAAKNN